MAPDACRATVGSHDQPEAKMRKSIHTAKDAATIAVGFPVAFVSLCAAAIVMAGAAVVTELLERDHQ